MCVFFFCLRSSPASPCAGCGTSLRFVFALIRGDRGHEPAVTTQGVIETYSWVKIPRDMSTAAVFFRFQNVSLLTISCDSKCKDILVCGMHETYVASIDSRNPRLRRVFPFSTICTIQITICDRKRTNLLHAACEMGHGVLASALIERYRFSVEDKDRKGDSLDHMKNASKFYMYT